MLTGTNRLLLLVFACAFTFTILAASLDLEALKSDAALSERQFFKDRKLDFVGSFSALERIKVFAGITLNDQNLSEEECNLIFEQISVIEQYQNFIINDILFSGVEHENNLSIVAKDLAMSQTRTEDLESLFVKPLISAVTEKIQADRNSIVSERDFSSLLIRLSMIREKEADGYYNELLEKGLSQDSLISVTSIGKNSAKIIFFDVVTNQIRSLTVFPGSEFSVYRVESVQENVCLQNVATGEKIRIGRVLARNTTKGTRQNLKIVPYFEWYSTNSVYELRDDSTLNVYVKIVDNEGNVVRDTSVTCNNKVFNSNSNGMIKIIVKPDDLTSTLQNHKITHESGCSMNFQTKKKPIDCLYINSASVGATAGVGGDILLASVTGALHPAYNVGLMFVSMDVNSTSKDRVVYTTNPSLAGSLSASLGPKLEPFKIEAFDKNLGAGATATVNGSIKLIAGYSQRYMFHNPYTTDRKAQCVLFADKMMDFAPVAKPIMSSLFAKMSNVNINDYMIEGNVALGGELSIGGNIGATLGLVDQNNNDAISGLGLDVISGSVTAGMGVEGAFLNGWTVFGPTNDKYQVVLKSNLVGNFSALKLSAKIFNSQIIPDCFLADTYGTMDMLFIFRFDENLRFTRSFIILNAGYLIRNSMYHDFIKMLIRQVKESGGNASDYAEVMNAIGVEKMFILIVDREKTEKFFGEWKAFSESIIKKNYQQSGDTVVAKVKGMFPAVQESLNRLVDYPILYVKKTDLKLAQYKPSFNCTISAGVKIKLGVNTSFTKTKCWHDEIGYLARFQLYPIEECAYNKDLARYKRDISYLMGSIKDYVVEEISDSATYVYEKAKDGTIYICQKVADGTVYVIEQTVDGVCTIAEKVGEEAEQIWNNVMNTVGDAAEYVYETGTEIIESVGNTLSNIWNSIWG